MVIDHLVVTMTTEELQQAGDTLKQVHLSTVISKTSTTKGPSFSRYDIEGVKGKILNYAENSYITIHNYCHEGSSEGDDAFKMHKE